VCVCVCMCVCLRVYVCVCLRVCVIRASTTIYNCVDIDWVGRILKVDHLLVFIVFSKDMFVDVWVCASLFCLHPSRPATRAEMISWLINRQKNNCQLYWFSIKGFSHQLLNNCWFQLLKNKIYYFSFSYIFVNWTFWGFGLLVKIFQLHLSEMFGWFF